MASDTERLKFLMTDGCMDGFFGVKKDRYEYAYDVAVEEGRDEPNEADELEGFRRLIDEAMLMPNEPSSPAAEGSPRGA
jgi:hypothetical protein